jgi:hypothetical protein
VAQLAEAQAHTAD